MIRLINNEYNKIKKSKLLFILVLFIITIYIMNKYSSKNIIDLSYNLIPFIGVFISILYSGSVCGEVDSGSMKYYLTNHLKDIKYIYLNYYLFIYIVLFV